MELFTILRSSISGKKLSDEEKRHISSSRLYNLFELSCKHDLGHLVAFGLIQNELVSQEQYNYEQYIFNAIYRYEKMRYEYEILCDFLEKAEISFLPLKGSVIRNYYPEPWMRTSCDIDILIQEKDIQRAVHALVNEHGYAYKGRGAHDVSLISPDEVHVELHYDLIDSWRFKNAVEILSKVWDTAIRRSGYNYWYEMTDEMFYFYHVAHTAKHFENGGCGIRPLIDLLILDSIADADIDKRDNLLQQGKLLQFANAARKLSKIWFSNEQHDLVTEQMESYILQGGVYGNYDNRIAAQQWEKGGHIKYVLSRIFIPYDTIKRYYPILEKHSLLTPFMVIYRWCRLIFSGRAKQVAKDLQHRKDISADKVEATKNLLCSIGL